MENKQLKQLRISTPLGDMIATAVEEKVVGLQFLQEDGVALDDRTPLLLETKSQVEAYFQGKLKEFSLPLLITASTPFAHKAYQALLQVKYGKTISYRQQAELTGHLGAARAVGSANSKNLLALLLPCHRVIRADGGSGGYWYGQARKVWLLKHELEH